MAYPIIDVEEVFSDFVEDYGGVVSDRLPGKGQKASNADFIFHESKVIAELKILKEDPFSSAEFKKSRKRKMQQWLQNGDITLQALKQVKTLGDLPPKCYRDAEKLYTRPVRTHLEKANQQIKSTKETEQLEDYSRSGRRSSASAAAPPGRAAAAAAQRRGGTARTFRSASPVRSRHCRPGENPGSLRRGYCGSP